MITKSINEYLGDSIVKGVYVNDEHFGSVNPSN